VGLVVIITPVLKYLMNELAGKFTFESPLTCPEY
jgi:hypothetical protein